MDNLFTETARRLARRGDPETSKKAAVKMVESGALNRQEEEVYKSIVRYVNYTSLHKVLRGFTTKDIAQEMIGRKYTYYQAYDICRKRFSGLERKGKIFLTGERRDGCQIWRLK